MVSPRSSKRLWLRFSSTRVLGSFFRASAMPKQLSKVSPQWYILAIKHAKETIAINMLSTNTGILRCTHSSVLSVDMLNFSKSWLAPASLMLLTLRSNTFRCFGFFSRAEARCLQPSASMQHWESLSTAQTRLASHMMNCTS